jgi:transcriptional regulator with XRE-family HTH domain
MPKARSRRPDAVRFGAIVRRLREQRGWTKQKVAMRAGITPQYLALVELGQNVPTLVTILDLIEVLGADIAVVMHELALARNKPLQSEES